MCFLVHMLLSAVSSCWSVGANLWLLLYLLMTIGDGWVEVVGCCLRNLRVGGVVVGNRWLGLRHRPRGRHVVGGWFGSRLVVVGGEFWSSRGHDLRHLSHMMAHPDLPHPSVG